MIDNDLKIFLLVPVISERLLFLKNLFYAEQPTDFCFKTVKIVLFSPRNPVLGTVPQKTVFICGTSSYSYDQHNY